MDGGIKFSRTLRLLLLAAFVVQCVVVQTHVHFARLIGEAHLSVSYHSNGPAERVTASGTVAPPDYCPLCWESAMAGHYVLPAADILPPPPAIFLWIAIPAMAEFGLRPFSHGWLSRAPPQ